MWRSDWLYWFMNEAASHLATRLVLQGLYKTEGFYRKNGVGWGKGSYYWKKRKYSFWTRTFFFWGEEEEKGFLFVVVCLWCRLPLLSIEGGIERAHMTDYLIGVDQTVSHWFINIMFLGEVETAINSGIKSRFGVMGFSNFGPMVFCLTLPITKIACSSLWARGSWNVRRLVKIQL